MSTIGINTDNFYKFICTISLAATIYCFSFDTIFLEPYNNKTTQLNLEKAELAAEIGYLKGVSSDLFEIIKDTIKYGEVTYFYYSKKDTSEFVKYYSNYKLTKETKLIIDSLNEVNRNYAKFRFKANAITQMQNASEKNYFRRELTFWVFGIISFVIFIWSLLKWFYERKEIDK